MRAKKEGVRKMRVRVNKERKVGEEDGSTRKQG